jgi:hypothetical protein
MDGAVGGREAKAGGAFGRKGSVGLGRTSSLGVLHFVQDDSVRQGQTQIPFGNDKPVMVRRGGRTAKDKGRRRFPSGMTNR